MAVQAPFHLQRVLLIHQRHLVDAAVATRAANTFIYVDGVIEVDVVWKVMDLDPIDRGTCSPTRPNRREHRGIGPDLRMTINTGLGRRNARIRTLLHRRVAVLALQAEAYRVVFVAERDGLVRPLPLPRHPGRSLQGVQRHTKRDDDQARQH